MSPKTRRLLASTRGLFPLRPAGVALLLLALYVGFRLSKAEADYLLYPASLVALGLVGLCALLVAAGAVRIHRVVRASGAPFPARLETTQPASTGFRLPRLARWLLLEVRVAWREPAGVGVTLEPVGGWLDERVTPTARGRYERVVRRVSVEDVFGLASVTFEVTQGGGLVIAPASGGRMAEPVPSHSHGDAVAHPTGREEGDLVEMRHYAHGDSLRHVLWKTFARTRRLLVRMPERAMAPRPLSVALFVAGPEDEASAGAARGYLEGGLLGPDFVFAADGAKRPTRSTLEAVEQLVDSARVRAEGGASLEALVQALEAMHPAAFLVFAPAADGPWRGRLNELVRRRGAVATVVIAVDRLAGLEGGAAGRWERLWFHPLAEEASGAGVLALKGALEADGHTVRLVHRPTGQTW